MAMANPLTHTTQAIQGALRFVDPSQGGEKGTRTSKIEVTRNGHDFENLFLLLPLEWREAQGRPKGWPTACRVGLRQAYTHATMANPPIHTPRPIQGASRSADPN